MKKQLHILFLLCLLSSHLGSAQDIANPEHGIVGVLVLDDQRFTQYIVLTYSIYNAPEQGDIEYYFYGQTRQRLFEKMRGFFRQATDMLKTDGWVYYSLTQMQNREVIVREPYGVLSLISVDPVRDSDALFCGMYFTIGYVEDGTYRRLDEIYQIDRINFNYTVGISLKTNGLWMSEEDPGMANRPPILVRKERTVEEVYLELY